MSQYIYHILSSYEYEKIKTPLSIALRELTGETVNPNDITVDKANLNFYYSKSVGEVSATISTTEAISLAKLVLQQINLSFNQQFSSGSAPVPNLFPLHNRVQDVQERGNNEGYTITIAFDLEVLPGVFLPVKEKYVTIYIAENGRFLALQADWSPITARQSISTVYDFDQFEGYYTSHGPDVTPDFFFEDASSGLLLPGVLFADMVQTGYRPTVNLEGAYSSAETVESNYNYEDENILRSTDEMDQVILGHLAALGLSFEMLNADVIRLTGLNDCFEALQAANALHVNDSTYKTFTWYQLEDFAFKISEISTDTYRKGTYHIRMGEKELIVSAKMLGDGYESCIEYKDAQHPDGDFKICYGERSDSFYDEVLYDSLEHPAHLDQNYFETTNDFLILQLHENASMSVFGVEVRDGDDKEQMMEAARLKYSDDNYIVVDASEMDEYLKDSGIPHVDAETVYRTGISSARVHAPTEYQQLATEGLYGKRNTSKLVGEAGELSLRSRRKWMDTDMNEIPWRDRRGNTRIDNHPIWDIRGAMYGEEALIQIKTSRAQTASSRFKTYDGGLFDIMGGIKNNRRLTLFQLIAIQDFTTSGLTPAEILSEAKRQGYLAVNDTDVGAYKEHVEAKIRRNPGKFSSYFDAHLETGQLEVEGHTFRSMAEIDAHPNAAIREKALTQLVELVKSRIIGNGVDTAGNQRLGAFHGELKSSGRTRAQIDRSMFMAPEAGMIEHLGKHKAGVQAGVRSFGPGIAMGAGFAMVGELTSGGEIDAGRVAVTGVSSGVGEATGTYLSMRAIPYPQLVTRYGASGALGGKALGGGIIGAVSAPVVELSVMLYDDFGTDSVDYEGYEYSSRVGSEAVGGLVVGATSGAIATGATGIIMGSALAGTALGTTVPIVGNVAGFAVGLVVGLAAYAAYSYFLKDAVQDNITTIHLAANDELYTMKGNWEVSDYGFFQVVVSRLPGGSDYVVQKTREKITIMNPYDGGYTEMVKIKPIRTGTLGSEARGLFRPDQLFMFVDERLLIRYTP